MRCAECGGRMERSLSPITEEFRGETVIVNDVEHYRCCDCGEIMLDADDLSEWSSKIDSAYRKMNNLLAPSEIADFRKSHKLSQKQFEMILGVSTPTVSRWETGKVCQTKPIDRLIRLLKKHPEELLHLAEMEEIVSIKSTTKIIPFNGVASKNEIEEFMSINSIERPNTAQGEFAYTIEAKEC